jgi:UDP-N-acetyl-D-galactosamine dehydrogenase
VLGLAFKEGVGDLRNSRVPDIVHELRSFGIDVVVADPYVDAGEARRQYGLELRPFERIDPADATVLAVAHPAFLEPGTLDGTIVSGGVLVDVKSALDPAAWSEVRYWSL